MNDYPSNWKAIAQEVKDAAGWSCIRCGHEHDTEAGYVLTVHHLDMDKANCRWWNLTALCQRCHLTIQARVKMARIWMFDHSEWFKPYVAGYYAHQFGLGMTEEEVRADPDSILNRYPHSHAISKDPNRLQA